METSYMPKTKPITQKLHSFIITTYLQDTKKILWKKVSHHWWETGEKEKMSIYLGPSKIESHNFDTKRKLVQDIWPLWPSLTCTYKSTRNPQADYLDQHNMTSSCNCIKNDNPLDICVIISVLNSHKLGENFIKKNVSPLDMNTEFHSNSTHASVLLFYFRLHRTTSTIIPHKLLQSQVSSLDIFHLLYSFNFI